MPLQTFVANLANFEQSMEIFKAEATKHKANFILFLADKDPNTGLSWCPDCVRAEPVIDDKLESCGQPVGLLRAYVGDRPTWRSPQHPRRVDRRFQLKGVPTLIRWDFENNSIRGRLEDHEAHLPSKIDALLCT